MTNGLIDQELQAALAAMVATEDVIALRAAMERTIRLMGFGSFFVLTPVTLDRRFGRVLTAINMPEKWTALYEAGLSQDDPMPDIALQTGRAFRWSDSRKFAKLDREERKCLATFERFGMTDGVAIPVFGPGGRTGYAGLAFPTSKEAMDDLRLHLLQGFTQISFTHYCTLIGAAKAAESRLSKRELEVVFWIAKGKSNSVIADILDISPETVDSYIRRVFAKLDVSDRTSAVLTAVLQGQIFPGDFVEFSQEAAPIETA